jgi:hypothetical protein
MFEVDYKYLREDGSETWCYGDIKPDSNFMVTCEDEELDGIAADIDGSEFNTWDKVCNYLELNYSNAIEEITTC